MGGGSGGDSLGSVAPSQSVALVAQCLLSPGLWVASLLGLLWRRLIALRRLWDVGALAPACSRSESLQFPLGPLSPCRKETAVPALHPLPLLSAGS